MTKRDAEQIYYLRKELKTLEEYKRQLEGRILSDDEELSKRAREELKEVRQALITGVEMLARQERLVTEYVMGIEDSQLRLIMVNRCIYNRTWAAVGKAVGISPDAAFMIYKRYWERHRG